MYGLPGYLIGAYGNQSYVSFAKERIFDPIGMASSTFWPSVASASKNLTQTWTGNGRQIPYWITDSQAEFISGAGGVISTAKDMVRRIKSFCHLYDSIC
jgi:CubicO group peptidase (beta-lactamase class C family)